MSNTGISSSPTTNSTTICVARQGKLCHCSTCRLSFVSAISTVSDVSTTCPPSEIDDRESFQDSKTPRRPRHQPLQAFSIAATTAESAYSHQNDNKALAGAFVGPNVDHKSPSKGSSNLPVSRAQLHARTDSWPYAASNRTVRSPKVKCFRRKGIVGSNATVDEHGREEPTTPLPPLPTIRALRAQRTQRLGPTQSDYNLTPTPAIPLGHPKNRRRFK